MRARTRRLRDRSPLLVRLTSRRWLMLLAVLLVGVGVLLRVAVLPLTARDSDVLDVTVAAIARVAAGGNPYGPGYAVSEPPGAPFVYGPVTLLWYLPVLAKPWLLELAVSLGLLLALAWRGRVVGLALYALSPFLVLTASDGSNDTSAGLLLLLTFIVARRHRRAGAVLLALAIAFKPYAAAWAPAFLVWAGLEVAASFLLASAVFWSPLLIWGLGSYLDALVRGNAVHPTPHWSLAMVWERTTGRLADQQFFDNLRLGLGALAMVVSLLRLRSLDAVILAGSTVYLITFFAGYWSSYAYLAGLAPLLCWQLDDWLGSRVEIGRAAR